MRPRILFIVQLPPPIHGVTMMNKYTVEHDWGKRNYDTKTLPLYFGQRLEDIGKITPGKLFHMIAFIFRLCYTMISFKPSLVYFTIVPTGKIFLRDALFTRVIKLFRPHIVFHLHKKGVHDIVRHSRFKRWIYKKTFRGVKTICLSEKLTQDIRTIYTRKPLVLHNGIDVVRKNIIKPVNKIPQIIFLSNLLKGKGILVFLQSLAELKRQGYQFTARIVGEPVDYSIEEAQAFCEEEDMADMVQVVGPRFGDDKFNELRCSDIFVLPSYNECVPLTILEAMQFGLPVVSTMVGGIPDIIRHGQTGLLIRPGSVKELSTTLQQLIVDKELRTRLGINARIEFMQHYTLDIYYDGLSDIFDEVLLGHRKKIRDVPRLHDVAHQ
jgi:glycosyltransferase involved in cell wall biosynthesis